MRTALKHYYYNRKGEASDILWDIQYVLMTRGCLMEEGRYKDEDERVFRLFLETVSEQELERTYGFIMGHYNTVICWKDKFSEENMNEFISNQEQLFLGMNGVYTEEAIENLKDACSVSKILAIDSFMKDFILPDKCPDLPVDWELYGNSINKLSEQTH